MQPEALEARARAATGLSEFGDPSFRIGLAALCESAEREARLNPIGRMLFEGYVGGALANRLAVEEYLRTHPECLAGEIAAPVFVFGHGRTGTTLLSYLLDCDPANRSLLHFEAGSSIPPIPRAAVAADPRVAGAHAARAASDQIIPEMKTIHREEPEGPTECVSVLAQHFHSMLYETLYNLPSYSRWLLESDARASYRYHRRVLQILQTGWSGRWVLKSPQHTLALPALLAVYPDAKLVMLHRDPRLSLASVLNLISTFTFATSEGDFRAYIVSHWKQIWREMATRAIRDRARLPAASCFDLQYADLMARPLETLAGLYAFLGWDFPGETEARMRRYLEQNPQGRHGRHSYSLERFGVSESELRELLGFYEDHFEIPRE